MDMELVVNAAVLVLPMTSSPLFFYSHQEEEEEEDQQKGFWVINNIGALWNYIL